MGLRGAVWYSDLFSRITRADGRINALVKEMEGRNISRPKGSQEEGRGADSRKSECHSSSKKRYFLSSKY